LGPEDDRPGCGTSGANISYSFWQRNFAGDPSVVGRRLTLDGNVFEVFGVTPPGFKGISVGDTFDVAVPICVEPILSPRNNRLTLRHAWWLASVGRLKPGWTIARANLANLMLARAGARERQITIRRALGASRWRMIRDLLSESLLLAVAGTVCGLFLAFAISRMLVAFISTPQSQILLDLGMDWRLLAFTTALAVLTTVSFGLAPAVRATRAEPATLLQSGSRGMSGGRERFSLRRILVVSQVALSVVLLMGALLFVRSLRNLTTLNVGFLQSGILVA